MDYYYGISNELKCKNIILYTKCFTQKNTLYKMNFFVLIYMCEISFIMKTIPRQQDVRVVK